MDQRKGHITRPGGKINDQIIELAPFDLAQELPNDRVQHRPAPDQRLVSGIEQADGNCFQPVYRERLDAILTQHSRLRAGAQHQRHVRTINISVKQPDLISKLRQSKRKIHRQRGLAHPSLAGSDGNNRFNSGQRLWPWRRLTGRLRHMCAQEITSKEESKI